jgi:hypothetical protein
VREGLAPLPSCDRNHVHQRKGVTMAARTNVVRVSSAVKGGTSWHERWSTCKQWKRADAHRNEL